jgi:hypothetical protein
VFKALFETYHSDTVSKAKLKQRAADLKVHPDETGNCVELYVASMATARLVTVAGDQITHLASAHAAAPPAVVEEEGADLPDPVEETTTEDSVRGHGGADGAAAPSTKGSNGADKAAAEAQREGASGATPRAVFNVNVTLDASLDVEKLELALLRRYGAL